MKKALKRVLALVLAVCLCMAMVPAAMAAAAISALIRATFSAIDISIPLSKLSLRHCGAVRTLPWQSPRYSTRHCEAGSQTGFGTEGNTFRCNLLVNRGIPTPVCALARNDIADLLILLFCNPGMCYFLTTFSLVPSGRRM